MLIIGKVDVPSNEKFNLTLGSTDSPWKIEDILR
jgi:hypothetical protein